MCGPATSDPAPIIIIDAHLNDRSMGEMLIFPSSTQTTFGASMADSSDHPQTDPPSQPQRSADQHEIGYGKPPKHSQFPKGKSGNPGGRPKAPIGISIKDMLDGDQMGKNGEVISKHEAIVIRMRNDAFTRR